MASFAINDRIYKWGLYIAVFFIPISSFISVRLFVLLFFGIIITSLINKKTGFFKIDKGWDLFFYLFILSIGLIYSEDVSVGIKTLETNFSLLALPIVFISVPVLNERRREEFFFIFISGLSIACVICIGNAFFQYFKSEDVSVFLAYKLTSLINVQPTYLAYYLILSITFGMYTLYYSPELIQSRFIIFILCFLFLMLVLTGGLNSFIGALFVFSFFILKFLVEKKTRSKTVVFILCCSMILCLIFTSRILVDRNDLLLTDSWERFKLWESAIDANPDLILGVGTGDKAELNQYYNDHGMQKFAVASYNSHNQFIQILFTNGILGLVAVLLLMGRPIYLSLKHQDVLGTLVFFPFLIYGITEVFLGRYQGVVFFALLHQIFVSYYLSQNNATAKPA